jgi:serine phosphatase RsbU (regulator of sigma subunit)/PAS domain-containing protein
MISVCIILESESEIEFIKKNLCSDLFSLEIIACELEIAVNSVQSLAPDWVICDIRYKNQLNFELPDFVCQQSSFTSIIFFVDDANPNMQKKLFSYNPLSIIEKKKSEIQFQYSIQTAIQQYMIRKELEERNREILGKKRAFENTLPLYEKPAAILEKSRIVACNQAFLDFFDQQDKEKMLNSYLYDYLPVYQINNIHSVVYFENQLLQCEEHKILYFEINIKKSELNTQLLKSGILKLDAKLESILLLLFPPENNSEILASEVLDNHKYKEAYFQARIGYLIIETSYYKIVDANPFTLDFFQTDFQEIRKKPLSEIFPDELVRLIHQGSFSDKADFFHLCIGEKLVNVYAQVSSFEHLQKTYLLLSFHQPELPNEPSKDEALKQSLKKEQDRKKIVEKHQRLNESLSYAQRIQSALMPSYDYLSKYLDNFFVFLQPKEIVSGDFYWANYRNGHFFLSLADATGHGVPAAFLSILGMSYLNEITLDMEKGKASQVLDIFKGKIVKSLNQEFTSNEIPDGFDMALLIINKEKMRMHFSAANMSAYMIRNKHLVEIKGDRLSIGLNQKSEMSFTNHQLRLQKGDKIYLFSDGITDQFGGTQNKKLFNSGLKQMIMDIEQLPMKEQREKLKQLIAEWKKNQEQIDDILLLGIQV